MIKFRDLKKKSKKSLKKNYVLTVLACTIGLIFLSFYSSTKSSLITFFECIQNYYDNGHFATNTSLDYIDSGLSTQDVNYNELYKLTAEELKNRGFNDSAIRYIHSLNANVEDKDNLVERLKVKDGFIKPILNFASSDFNIIFRNCENLSLSIITGEYNAQISYTVIMGILMMFLYRIFISNPLQVGYSRFFLENSKYHKTRLGRIFSPFNKNYLKICRKMARKTLFKFLWNFTIIGGIIKGYSYRLVPYIIAEDSEVSSKDAIKLSKKLMKGYKWKAFILDFTFFGWNLLDVFSMGILGLLFVNPYVEGTNAEFYKAIIKEKKNKDFYKNYLDGREYADNDLYIDEDKDFYPGAKPQENYFANQHYSGLTLFTLFFVFAFAGWCMEVALFLLKTHSFVNRGTLYGPWLPIYGFGCVLILIVFTKTRLKKHINNPILLFLNIMVLCGMLEYFTSWVIEVTTGLKYWDYAGHFLSINGRICFENLCEFGAGGLLCIYILAPKLNLMLADFDKKKLKIIVILLSLLFVVDNIFVRICPRTGYGITESIIDENGNLIDKDGNIIR